jgi:hypothetical protein
LPFTKTQLQHNQAIIISSPKVYPAFSTDNLMVSKASSVPPAKVGAKPPSHHHSSTQPLDMAHEKRNKDTGQLSCHGIGKHPPR